MSDTNKWGQYYWCIKVPTGLSLTDEIYVCADRLEVLEDGSLICWGKQSGGDPLITLGLAATKWNSFYAASCIDGSPVSVEHWVGEVARTSGDAELARTLKAKTSGRK